MFLIELKQFEDYKGAMRTLHRIVGVPLTRKLLNHWSLVVELYSRHNDLGNRYCRSVSQITTDVFPLLESQFVSYIISHELSHQLVCKTNRAGITYASGASVFTPVYLWDTVIFSYLCSVLYIILSNGRKKKDKKRSTNHYTQVSKNRVTRIPLKLRGKLSAPAY
jgi:hypothetical protein